MQHRHGIQVADELVAFVECEALPGLGIVAGDFWKSFAEILTRFAPENRERVRAAIADEIARALKDGFTDVELADAKRALMQARRIARAQDGALAGGLVQQTYVDRTWDYAAQVDRGIEAVTLEKANAVLRRYVAADGFAWSYAGDFAKKK